MVDETSVDAGVFLALIAASPDAVLIAEESGSVVFANARCVEMLGYPMAELTTLTLGAVVPQALSPDLQYQPGDPARGSTSRDQMEVILARADGSPLSAEISVVSIATTDAHHTGVTIRDLSTRRRDEERFRELLDAAPDATIIADARGRIVLTNRQVEANFGYTAEELLDQPVEVLIPERFRGPHERLRDGYVGHPNVRGMGAGMELFARRKDGSEFPVEVSLAPLQTSDGVLVSAAVRDSTERLRIENSAAQMREEFLATVSHELRSPLTSIIGYIEVLEDLPDDQLGDQARRLLEVVERNARRELRIVNDLLTLTQVQQGLVLASDSVDLAAVVAAGLEDSRVASERAGVPVRLHTTADQPTIVRGDPQRLAQVVSNVLTNAVKFTAKGHIDVTLSRRGDVVELVVADTGMGMAPDEVEQAFERHYRAPGAVNAHVPGAGLGLPITRAIVEGHRGQITLESEQGKGTRVTVWLPAEHDPRP